MPGQDDYNPFSDRSAVPQKPGQYQSFEYAVQPADENDPEGKPAGEKAQPKGYRMPGQAQVDENALQSGQPYISDTGSYGGDIDAYEEAKKNGLANDDRVRETWKAYQDQTGAPLTQRTEFPPGYTPYSVKLKQGNLEAPTHMKSEADPSYANAQKNLAEAQSLSQPGTDPSTLPQAPVTSPRAGNVGGGGGGGGGGGSVAKGGILAQLGGDYDEQLRAMQQELDARENAGRVQAQSLQGESNLMRDQAGQREQEVQQLGQERRSHLDHIGQLVQDYASQQIDPYKFWHDANVPQKIGVIVGALAAGFAGGPQGAERFVNGQIDRSIALQQDALHREGRAVYEANNLFANYMKISGDEQEAYDKTRATMLGAAMVDAQKAAVEAGIPVESAEMRQFMATLKQQRDTLFAKLMMAQKGGGGQQGPEGWLMADPQTLVKGLDGQDYIIANKAQSDDVTNMLTAFARIKEGLAQGQQILSKRDWTDYANPFSANIKQGEAIDGSMAEAIAKLASARGVPSSVLATVKEQIPQFGSRGAVIDAPKIEQMNKLLDKWATEVVSQNRGVPVETRMGPGVGKAGQNELKYWVRPGVTTTPQGQQVENKRQYSSFQPRQ